MFLKIASVITMLVLSNKSGFVPNIKFNTVVNCYTIFLTSKVVFLKRKFACYTFLHHFTQFLRSLPGISSLFYSLHFFLQLFRFKLQLCHSHNKIYYRKKFCEYFFPKKKNKLKKLSAPLQSMTVGYRPIPYL